MNLRRMVRCSVVAIVCLWLSTQVRQAQADVRLASLFTNHMVLQRNAKLPVWGTADPGEAISVAVGGRTATTTAGHDGKWMVKLDAISEPGPFVLSVKGKNTLTVEDVLVGEVWVCSGQSNMQWTVANSNNRDQEIASANYPLIRLFSVPLTIAEQPQTEVKGQWRLCEPQSIAQFSAVSYFFGRELHKTLNVPVGLIHSSWGGTLAEAWTPRTALEADAGLGEMVVTADARAAAFVTAQKAYTEQLAAWEAAAKAAKEAGTVEPEKPKAPVSPFRNSTPSSLYNAMIAPLVPFAIKGAIWYQGESNASRANQYRTLFPTLIKSWRSNWGQGDFPFLFVQLANYMPRADQPGDSNWAELREAQYRALSLPRTGMAVAIDIGEAGDIHPRNKQDVGRRLALIALATEYGQKIEYSGPIFQSMKIEGNSVRLTFKHANGLKVSGDGPLQGFAIAGEDRKFVWANARIEGKDVIVSSDQVAQPVAVRYAWANNPAANLYNGADLPASPFRTDTWPGIAK